MGERPGKNEQLNTHVLGIINCCKAMINLRPKKHCCVKITQISVWNGIDSSDRPTNGPIVKCDDCGLEFHLTWENWEKILEENKSVREEALVR